MGNKSIKPPEIHLNKRYNINIRSVLDKIILYNLQPIDTGHGWVVFNYAIFKGMETVRLEWRDEEWRSENGFPWGVHLAYR
jgi:hypothetical protein